jgi:dipeptidyl aminopeptidase/acylaminoacyl peptidase
MVFAQADRVMAAEFDAKALRVTGQPRPIATGVLNKDNATNFATTADGNAAYISGHDVSLMHRLAWVDRSATHIPIGEALEYPRNLRVSPDGRRLALTIGPGGRGQIWIYDLKGTGQPVKLTVQGHNLFPIWSPDSKQIAFLSREGSQNRLLLLPVDGSSTQPEPLIKEEFVGVPTGWSPDGNYLLVIRQPPAKMWLTAIRDRTLHQWLQTPFSEWGGRFSPDGHWVTYASDQTGTSEVWVRPFPGPGAPVRISPDGGQKSLWSKDGKEIFYENGAKVMVARVTTHGSQIEAEPPHMLFEGGFERDETDPHIRFLDAAADGRLVVVEANRESNHASLVIAQHWDANLQK